VNLGAMFRAGLKPSAPVRRTLVIMAVLAMALPSLIYVLPPLRTWHLTPDYSMLWTGGRFAVERPADLYDVDLITREQAWLRRITGPLPFIYPPSALPLLAPFALLPFWVSYWSWTLASCLAFWTAARRVASRGASALAFVSPHLVLVLILGQTTLFVGAALIWGLSLLRSKPFLAGFMIGLAAAIKPQSAIVAPVAFAAGRHWSAFAGAAAGGVGMVLLSLPFGPALWLDWLNDLGTFNDQIDFWDLHQLGATPAMLAQAAGLSRYAVRGAYAAGAILGVLIVWRGFRTEDLKLRTLCFFGGSFLVSPYAIRYELAMLAPVLAGALLLGTLRGFVTALPLYAVNVFAIVPALLVSLGTALSGPPWPRRDTSEPANDRSRGAA